MEELLSNILQAIICVGQKVICVGDVFLSFLIDLALYIPRHLFSNLMIYFGDYIVSINIALWINALYSKLNFLNATLGYFLDLAQLGYGLLIVIPSIVLRFILRHLPVIGG